MRAGLSSQWNRKLTQMEAMRGKMEFLPDAGHTHVICHREIPLQLIFHMKINMIQTSHHRKTPFASVSGSIACTAAVPPLRLLPGPEMQKRRQDTLTALGVHRFRWRRSTGYGRGHARLRSASAFPISAWTAACLVARPIETGCQSLCDKAL